MLRLHYLIVTNDGFGLVGRGLELWYDAFVLLAAGGSFLTGVKVNVGTN